MNLTSGEFSLLRAFVERPQRVLTRDQLLEFARGPEVGRLRPGHRRADQPAAPQARRRRRRSGADPHRPQRGLYVHRESLAPLSDGRPRASPLFAQVLWLVIATLAMTQVAALVVILSLPPPALEVYTVADVVAAVRLEPSAPREATRWSRGSRPRPPPARRKAFGGGRFASLWRRPSASTPTASSSRSPARNC